MTRVASLTLLFLSIERLRRLERTAARHERSASMPDLASRLPACIDDNPGACSVPRGGGWHPGARWARNDTQDDLPTHQRPTMREMGRRSELADHPFHGSTAGGCALDGARNAPASVPVPALNLENLSWVRPMVLITRSGERETITSACPLSRQLGLHPGRE